MTHNTTIVERMGWRNMDPEQFCSHCLPLLSELAKRTVRVSKKDILAAIQAAKLQLSAPECALFVEKIATTWEYVKRKLRDAGSGARLPASCATPAKIWQRHHCRPDASRKKSRAQHKAKFNMEADEQQQVEQDEPFKPVEQEQVEQPFKAVEQKQVEPFKAVEQHLQVEQPFKAVEQVEQPFKAVEQQAEVEQPFKAVEQEADIRTIFGLAPKKVDVVSVDSDASRCS